GAKRLVMEERAWRRAARNGQELAETALEAPRLRGPAHVGDEAGSDPSISTIRTSTSWPTNAITDSIRPTCAPFSSLMARPDSLARRNSWATSRVVPGLSG